MIEKNGGKVGSDEVTICFKNWNLHNWRLASKA